MGTEKDKQLEQEEAWSNKARAEDLRCSVCSLQVPYGDRDIYFKTRMCAYCANREAKNE